MNIKEMYEEGKKMGLKEGEVFPYGNPQRLTMRELVDRLWRLECSKSSEGFRGGAWSGD